MSDDIIIRKANESDLAEILTLINSPVADNGTAMELRDANTIYQFILDDSNYFQVVASDQEGLVAIATLAIIMQMTHEGSTSAIVTDLVVSSKVPDKEYLAADLLQYTTSLAHEYGCHKVIIASDYQQELIASGVKDLKLEQGPASYLLPE